MGQVIKNAITGRDEYIINDDGIFDAVTGVKVAYIENGEMISVVTGRSVGTVVSDGEGTVIDLSFITAEAEDILEGKISADKDGNPITGTLIKGTDVTATTATAEDVLADKQFYDAAGNLTIGVLQIAEAGGGETNFYKCASVGSAGGGSGNIIRVSGAGHTPANGDYVQTDPTATGWNRVWQLENASFVIAANTDYAGGEYWYLAPELGGYADEYIYYGLGTNPENPWEVDSWEANRGADEPIPTFEAVGGGSESNEEIRLFYNSDIGSWEFRGNGGGYYMELMGNRNPPVGSGFEFPDGEYGENLLSLEWGADGTSIIVSGATDHPQVNGTYALHEGSGTDSNSVWLKAPANAESSGNTWSGYKAVLVTATETTEIPGEQVVVISGATIVPAVNGTYRFVDSSATGRDRVLQHESADYTIEFDSDDYWWVIKSGGKWVGYASNSGDSEVVQEYWGFHMDPEQISMKNDKIKLAYDNLVGSTETKEVKYYEFEETLTEGLTYGSGFTPVVGKVYADGCMIEAKLVEGEKAIFYEPFDGSLKNDFTQRGSAPVFDTINGRKCMLIDTSHTFSCPADGLPTGNAPRTVAAWIYTNNDYGWSRFVEYGKNGSDYQYASGSAISMNYTSVNLCPGLGNYDIGRAVWAHVAIVYDGSIANLYINGTLQKSGAYAVNTDINGYPLTLGYSAINSDNRTNGYISELKIYDYALTAEEVNALANS